MILRVVVEYKGRHYLCMPTRNGFKCGKCLWGKIDLSVKKYRCKVCGAELSQILEEITNENN